MPLETLNHFTVYAVDLERSRDFWRDVMGLIDGDRPPLGFPGHWMYSAGAPTVHLVGPRDGDDGKPARRTQPTGQFDHIAFTATGLTETRARLQKHGVTFREQVVPRDGQTQIFLHDPDGVGIELNFPPSEQGT